LSIVPMFFFISFLFVSILEINYLIVLFSCFFDKLIWQAYT